MISCLLLSVMLILSFQKEDPSYVMVFDQPLTDCRIQTEKDYTLLFIDRDLIITYEKITLPIYSIIYTYMQGMIDVYHNEAICCLGVSRLYAA